MSSRSVVVAGLLLIAAACGSTVSDTTASVTSTRSPTTLGQATTTAPPTTTAASTTTTTTASTTTTTEAAASSTTVPATEPPDRGGFEPLSRKEVVKRARAEGGELVVYSEATDAKNDLLRRAFEAEYPEIAVRVVRLTPTDLIERFLAEAAAGATVASVVQGTSLAFQADQIAVGSFVPLTHQLVPVLAEGYPDEFLRAATGNAVNSITPWGICVNTDLVAEADLPEEFADLASPRFEGAILVADPNVADVYYGLWDLLITELGDEVVGDIAANFGKVFQSGVPAAQAVAAGQGAVELVCVPVLAVLVASESAPVQYIQPSLTTALEHRPSLVADGPDPYKARLWIDFALSKQGVAAWAQFDLSPWEPDTLPADLKLTRIDFLDRQAVINEILGIAAPDS